MVYPYTFNADDFEPITGTIHQPPPVQQTFDAPGFVVCTFAPRMLDTHPEAIKVPYAHSNVQADEVLYYVRGRFGSRRGVEEASFTLHPRGIPHGPHPGTIVASRPMTRTDELAVMVDTFQPLQLTRQASSWTIQLSLELAGLKPAGYGLVWISRAVRYLPEGQLLVYPNFRLEAPPGGWHRGLSSLSTSFLKAG